MGGHVRQRSGAVRLAVGGVLAAGLMAASAAWACSPQAVTVAVDQDKPVLAGNEVVLQGSTYTHEVVEAKTEKGAPRTDLDEPGAGYQPVKIQIHEGVTWEEAMAAPPLPVLEARGPEASRVWVETTALTGPAYVAKLRLNTLGYHYYWAFAVRITGELVLPRPITYRVVDELETAQEPPDPDPSIPPTTLAPPPPSSIPGQLTTAPERSRAGGATPSRANTAAPVNATGPPEAGGMVSPSPDQAAPPVQVLTDPVTPPMFPAHEDLWSGLDPAVAPSLLDERPLPPKDAGWPLGAGVLGLGVLTLAGAAAFAGERRLALAGRFRS